MNDFISKKLGEVLAFARIGTDTLAKGRKGFLKIIDAATIDELDAKFGEFEERVKAFAAQEEVTEEVEKSAKETSEKVTDMRDTYIDGNWDEQSEVLEWTGFYTGAALVHWHLLSGAGKERELDELKKISRKAIDFYGSLFTSDEKLLEGIGAKGKN